MIPSPDPVIQVGDRVLHLEMNQYADVLDIKDGQANCHWGTEWGTLITSWQSLDKLVWRPRPKPVGTS